MKRRKTFAWIYRPGLMDKCDPAVIRGRAIETGSRVRIAREHFPHMLPRAFVVIEDRAGNLQSVWRKALVSARQEAQTRAILEEEQ